MAKDKLHLPPSLKRRPAGTVEPRPNITIYCEGLNTEPSYFEAVREAFGNRLVSVKPIGGVGVPLTIIKMAVAAKKAHYRSKRDSFSLKDEFWAAFDCDTHPDLPKAFAQALQNSIGIAYSNPCFELWAIIHYRDHDAPISASDAQRLLGDLMPSYDRHGSKLIDCQEMIARYEDAKPRAQKMCARRIEEGDARGNPFTNVHDLVDLIIMNGRGVHATRGKVKNA